jgi:hypothetical protein
VTKKDSMFLDDNKVFKMIGLIVAGLIAMFFLLENIIPKSSNNATLIIVYRTTKKYEKRNEGTLEEIQRTEKEQHKILQKLENYVKELGGLVERQEKHADELEKSAFLYYYDNLNFLSHRLQLLDDEYKKLETKDFLEKEKIRKNIDNMTRSLSDMSKSVNLEHVVRIRNNDLRYKINQRFREIISNLDISTLTDGYPPSKWSGERIFEQIEELINKFPKDLLDTIPKDELI